MRIANEKLHRTGRVALVTGGGSGIGREICAALAAVGCAIGVADINVDGVSQTVERIVVAGGTATDAVMDVTSMDSVEDARMKVIDELGPINILVNCAGWDQLMPFLDTDEPFWDKVIDINYKGILRTTHACLPDMVDARWGRVVNIASDAARVGSSLEAVYAGAKGGVISFTKTIAREMARKGVTANVVCPGPTDTPLIESIVADSDDGDKVIGAMTRAVPMKRMAEPSEIASAVVYFASEEAGFVTGQTLSVSGGLTMA